MPLALICLKAQAAHEVRGVVDVASCPFSSFTLGSTPVALHALPPGVFSFSFSGIRWRTRTNREKDFGGWELHHSSATLLTSVGEGKEVSGEAELGGRAGRQAGGVKRLEQKQWNWLSQGHMQVGTWLWSNALFYLGIKELADWFSLLFFFFLEGRWLVHGPSSSCVVADTSTLKEFSHLGQIGSVIARTSILPLFFRLLSVVVWVADVVKPQQKKGRELVACELLPNVQGAK